MLSVGKVVIFSSKFVAIFGKKILVCQNLKNITFLRLPLVFLLPGLRIRPTRKIRIRDCFCVDNADFITLFCLSVFLSNFVIIQKGILKSILQIPVWTAICPWNKSLILINKSKKKWMKVINNFKKNMKNRNIITYLFIQ